MAHRQFQVGMLLRRLSIIDKELADNATASEQLLQQVDALKQSALVTAGLDDQSEESDDISQIEKGYQGASRQRISKKNAPR